MKKIRLILTNLLLAAMIATTVTPVYADELPLTEEVTEAADEASPEDVAEDEAISETADEAESLELTEAGTEDGVFEAGGAKDNTASGNPPFEIKKIPASERVIAVDRKGTYEEAVAKLPDKWTLVFENGDEEEAGVSWTCKDDFDKDELSSYVFAGTLADETLNASVSDEMAKRLTMEIYFEDQQWNVSDSSEMPFMESRISPYSLLPEIDKEEGNDIDDADFLSDYGANADCVIETGREFVGANAKLPSSTSSIMKKISPVANSYYYQHMSKAQKKFYNNVDKAVTQYLYYGKKPGSYAGTKVTRYISYSGLSMQGAFNVFQIYYANNPQAFFLTTSATSNGSGMAIKFLPDAASASKLKSRAKTIASNLNTMSRNVRKKNGIYNKIKQAQYLLCKRVSYDHYANNSTSMYNPWSQWKEGHIMYCQSLMSAFSGNRKMTVCAGYGKSMTSLLRLAGIEACDISGSGHEWTKAYVNGKWYCLDATWDDTDSNLVCRYDYLLKSDTAMNAARGGHYWNYFWNGVAPKSGSNYNPKAKTYKIKYHLNKGTNSRMNPGQYTASAGKIKLYKPTRKGYKFVGWYSNKKFKGKKITSIKASKKKNVNLYARWKKK
ncbi:MAG: InlB B-repeat-containing protein [Lachnospiraceae bacterium]|nr:InlB B-repeat-containing protein [Lachnospiraceae bacterium]